MEDTELNLGTLASLFADENAARQFLETKLWPNGPVCQHCKHTKAYALKAKPDSKSPVRAGVYKCAKCRKQFTVCVGTIFEDSHIPLRKWLKALHLMTSGKKGVSSSQISRELKISIQSAWFLTHRIREAMTADPDDPFLNGTVEIDETYVGGKPRKTKGKHEPGRATDKVPVLVMVERDGYARANHVNRVTAKELKEVIRNHVRKDAKIVTDQFGSYHGLGKEYHGGHSVVNHSLEYVNKDGEHTNTAESFFALLKRGHYGIFHSFSKEHLERYCTEFAFRWNNRKMTDGERMVEAIRGAEGKRLMYRESAADH